MDGTVQERFGIDAAQIEDAGADLERVAGLRLRQRVLNRDARRVVVEAVAGVDAARLHEPGADALVVGGGGAARERQQSQGEGEGAGAVHRGDPWRCNLH